MTRTALDVLKQTRAVLLDFDGPVCGVFSGYPAPRVAADLYALLRGEGVPLSPESKNVTDPLALLRQIHRHFPKCYADAEEFLTVAEVRSVSAATPTPGAIEFMEACAERRRPLAIVSNNSPEAVRVFLQERDLTPLVIGVFGREKTTPERMKPHPHLLGMAAEVLATAPRHCLMVGDSPTDIEAAHALGMRAVGYADTPGKESLFRALDCEAVIDSMALLAKEVRR